MTAPLVTPSRDALADFLAAHDAYRVNEDGWTVCLCGYVTEGDDDDGSHARHLADVLAGVVRDPATLADDDALVERIGKDPEGRVVVRHVLRALAAALTEDPS